MAEADWTLLGGGGSALGTGAVARGATNGLTRPYGGGNFCHGFKALGTDTGFAGSYVNLANFVPIAGTKKGGSIRAAMKKYSSGTTYAPMIGLIAGTSVDSANGYLLGLSEGSSYNITLKKGFCATGLSLSDTGILRSSTLAYTAVGDAATTWLHLRLDVLVNPHGEVVLKVYQNDISDPADSVATPSWTAVTGMDTYIDDSIGILSGTTPVLDGFYAIFGHYTSNATGSTSLFDHIEVYRQTAP